MGKLEGFIEFHQQPPNKILGVLTTRLTLCPVCGANLKNWWSELHRNHFEECKECLEQAWESLQDKVEEEKLEEYDG